MSSFWKRSIALVGAGFRSVTRVGHLLRRCGPMRADETPQRLIELAARSVLASPSERRRYALTQEQDDGAAMVDYVFASDERECDPNAVFDRLRWGGQFVFVTPKVRQARTMLERFDNRAEYVIDKDVHALTMPGRDGERHISAWCFVIRKVLIVRPNEATHRYSYDVRLIKSGDDYVVLKQIPSFDDAWQALMRRVDGITEERAQMGARKLLDKVFPLCLTREAALLKIVERDMPDRFAGRTPSVLKMDQDERGLVHRMHLNWLRLGGEPMSQLTFAREGLELLDALHEHVGVMHLDLRLDNMVVTEQGVKFIDFGSAVRVGEDWSSSPLLQTIFTEMISTSQVQRDLKRLADKGQITSQAFLDRKQRIDKVVDLFYFLLEMNNPLASHDFRGLVDYRPGSEEAMRLARLTREVFRPQEPQQPRYRTAGDVRRAIDEIGHLLGAA